MVAIGWTGRALVQLIHSHYLEVAKVFLSSSRLALETRLSIQIGLCFGLAFTFPIMMHPIHEIVEGKLKDSGLLQKLCYENSGGGAVEKFGMYASRALLVVVLGVLASCVPGFGMFVSLVGSTVCALLSFVLPSMFHLVLMGSYLRLWQRALDFCILTCGLVFAAYGTYSTIVGVSRGSS